MFYRIRALYDPARFQSHGRRDGWFEGWYFKLVDAVGRHPLAVIPGVSRDEAGGTSHSFVQVIRPGGAVRYHRYPFDAFHYERERFGIRVGPNVFSAESVSLDIPASAEGPRLVGTVHFGPWREWPVTLLAPGIMGWYRYVPRMECYHGVLSMDHELSGGLELGDERLDFEGGRGYTEKDWGVSFPSSWVWAQSNRFEDEDGHARPGTSLTLSVARIPWLNSSFTGHIAGVLLDSGQLVRFTTYTGSRIREIETFPGGARVMVADRRHELSVRIDGAATGNLKAPQLGAMTGRADEALDASVAVDLRGLAGPATSRSLFAGTGYKAGVEIMNSRNELAAG